jgi:hypothetical protein
MNLYSFKSCKFLSETPCVFNFQGEIEKQGTYAEMQNSGLNFAKLLAKDENESDGEQPTPEIRASRRIKSVKSNAVSNSN